MHILGEIEEVAYAKVDRVEGFIEVVTVYADWYDG